MTSTVIDIHWTN